VQENVGDRDQQLRWLLGSGLVVAALGPLGAREGRVRGLGALVGGALVLESAITRTCPVSAWLGIDTRERDRPASGSWTTTSEEEQRVRRAVEVAPIRRLIRPRASRRAASQTHPSSSSPWRGLG
jgi:hypothetical protein